jgi:hypothetical protein
MPECSDHDVMVARSIVSENATIITQAKIMAALANGLHISGEQFAKQAEAHLGALPGIVAQAREHFPGVEWELCVKIAVQHEIHRFHMIYPGGLYGPMYLAAATATAEAICAVVHMKDKEGATVQ